MVDTNASNAHSILYRPATPSTERTVINEEQDLMFNYELVLSRYMDACKDYFEKSFSITGPWTIKARNHIINFIKSNVMMMMDLVYNLDPSVLTIYQIVFEDGLEKLVLSGTAIEVLPYEESFDIFVEIHRNTNHSGSEVIMKKLEKQFEVHATCLEIFLSSCNVCEKSKLENNMAVAFNDCIVIEILKAPIQDDVCKYIMFYMDRATYFVLIRPLINMDEYELSIEMLKIFTDFGPPLIIESKHAPFLNNVLTILERGGFKYDISIHSNDEVALGKSYMLMEQIITRTNPGSTNWATTCRFVQYEYNHTVQILDNVTMASNKFTVRPHQKLFSTKFPVKYNVEDGHQVGTSDINDVLNTEDSITNQYGASSQIESCRDNSETVDVIETIENLPFNTRHSLVDNNNGDDITDLSNVGDKIDAEKNICTHISSPEPSHEVKQEPSDKEVQEIDPLETVDIKMEDDPLDTYKFEPQKYSYISDVPLKEELTIVDEPLKSVSSKTLNKGELESETENLPAEIEADKLAETYFPVDAVQTKSETVTNNLVNKHKKCHVCDGIMLTDFMCFGCKKCTHVFCMKRLSEQVEKPSGPMKCYTYCAVCFETNN